KLDRLTNLTVMNVPMDGTRALATLAQRMMDLHCTIQDAQILIGNGQNAVQLELATLKGASVPFGH
ncbi:MAG: YaeQ family protein, partial [Nitrospirota bacterium]|nr:YaeQ family protein [Nitrospirota bacterium]